MVNVHKFMKREPDAGVPMNLKKLQTRVARATGILERSAGKTVKEMKTCRIWCVNFV
jgi:hypothetical protein